VRLRQDVARPDVEQETGEGYCQDTVLIVKLPARSA
jgi:hypothetical protein